MPEYEYELEPPRQGFVSSKSKKARVFITTPNFRPPEVLEFVGEVTGTVRRYVNPRQVVETLGDLVEYPTEPTFNEVVSEEEFPTKGEPDPSPEQIAREAIKDLKAIAREAIKDLKAIVKDPYVPAADRVKAALAILDHTNGTPS